MFKKIALAAVIAVSTNCFCYSMDAEQTVFMPYEHTLTQIFYDFGMNEFANKTDVVNRLARRKLSMDEIENAKQLVFADYYQTIEGSTEYRKYKWLHDFLLFDSLIDTIVKNNKHEQKRLRQIRDKMPER